jgi:hypothetical protein
VPGEQVFFCDKTFSEFVQEHCLNLLKHFSSKKSRLCPNQNMENPKPVGSANFFPADPPEDHRPGVWELCPQVCTFPASQVVKVVAFSFSLDRKKEKSTNKSQAF